MNVPIETGDCCPPGTGKPVDSVPFEAGAPIKTRSKRVSPAVEAAFEASVAMTVVSDGDLYGGKICAALDRQHPRDLFDVKFLLEDQGVTEQIRQGFIVYLAGHDETLSDLLDPKKRDIAATFKTEFQGMPLVEVPLPDLLKARDDLISAINEGLTKPERQFLLSLKEGDPQWSLLPIPGLERLPAIQWKLQNIRKMDSALRKKQSGRLKKILGL